MTELVILIVGIVLYAVKEYIFVGLRVREHDEAEAGWGGNSPFREVIWEYIKSGLNRGGRFS